MLWYIHWKYVIISWHGPFWFSNSHKQVRVSYRGHTVYTNLCLGRFYLRVNHGKRAYCQVDTFGKLGCPEFTMALPCHSPVYCGLVLCDRVKLMVLPSVHPELPFSSILDNLRDKCKQRLLDNLHVTDAMHHNAIFLKCRGKQRNNIYQ